MSTHTLLHIDASPRGERSHSRKLGHEFVSTWKVAHPDGAVVSRDVGTYPLPFVTEAWVEGAFTPPEGHSDAAKEAIRISDGLVDELLAADELVVTTPIYNLNVPAALKAWIDHVVRYGRTFTIGAEGYKGLVEGKRVTVLVASGGDFRPGSPAAGYNFLEPYLRAIFGFIGITDVRFAYAHSLNQTDEVREQSLVEAQTAVRELAAA
ncbi:MAG: FMN-dependent NADH-azoreductase [Chthoniobacterales bacterium]